MLCIWMVNEPEMGDGQKINKMLLMAEITFFYLLVKV